MSAGKIFIPARRGGLAFGRSNVLLGIVVQLTGFPRDAILSRGGSAALGRARHLYIRLQRDCLGFSQPMIAAQTGGRDHTTILSSLQRSAALIASDPEFASLFEEARSRAMRALSRVQRV